MHTLRKGRLSGLQAFASVPSTRLLARSSLLGNPLRRACSSRSLSSPSGAVRSARVASVVMDASSSRSFRYVVLGGGNAAGYAAREFASHGLKPGDLCIVGDEPTLPYERPALSKGVLMNSNVRLPAFHTCVGSGGERQNDDFYGNKGIEVMRGQRVVEVDIGAKELKTESGSKVAASEALILCTGAQAIRLDKMPGAGLRGIYYLRNNADAMELYDALQKNKNKSVLVVGGGYIGMEVAAAAAKNGCKVKMIFPEEHMMPRLFTADIAKHYHASYEQNGVELLCNGRVCKAFLDDGSGAVRGALVCKDDEEMEVDASMIVVGVGAKPSTAMFQNLVKMDDRGGIVVDGQMKTSVDGVYAVGDIATFPLKMYGGRPTRVEHVGNARSSAIHAVQCILGSTEEYDYLPFFYSRVFDHSWQFFGENTGECVVCGDFAPKLAAFWVDNGAVSGVFCESPSEDDTSAMKAIAKSRPKASIAKLKTAKSADEAFAMLKETS